MSFIASFPPMWIFFSFHCFILGLIFWKVLFRESKPPHELLYLLYRNILIIFSSSAVLSDIWAWSSCPHSSSMPFGVLWSNRFGLSVLCVYHLFSGPSGHNLYEKNEVTFIFCNFLLSNRILSSWYTCLIMLTGSVSQEFGRSITRWFISAQCRPR